MSKNGTYNTEANLSPDGTLVVYSRMTDFGHRIFVQDMLTGIERQITFGPGSDEQPSFCADSYFIAFASTRGGGRGIYLTTRHGGDAKQVPTGGGQASFPRWGMPVNAPNNTCAETRCNGLPDVRLRLREAFFHAQTGDGISQPGRFHASSASGFTASSG